MSNTTSQDGQIQNICSKYLLTTCMIILLTYCGKYIFCKIGVGMCVEFGRIPQTHRGSIIDHFLRSSFRLNILPSSEKPTLPGSRNLAAINTSKMKSHLEVWRFQDLDGIQENTMHIAYYPKNRFPGILLSILDTLKDIKYRIGMCYSLIF